MFSRRIEMPIGLGDRGRPIPPGADRVSIDTVHFLDGSTAWIGLGTGTIKVIDLNRHGPSILAPEPLPGDQDRVGSGRATTPLRNATVAHVVAIIPAHTQQITGLLEVGAEMWSASRDGTIAVCSISPPQRLTVDPTQGGPAVGFDGDSRWVLPILTGHASGIAGLTLDAGGGAVYSCDLGGVVLCWSSATKAPLRRFAVGGQITSIVYADGALWLGLTAGVMRVNPNADADAGPATSTGHDPAAGAMCLSILEGWVFELKAESARFVRHDRLPDGAGGGMTTDVSMVDMLPPDYAPPDPLSTVFTVGTMASAATALGAQQAAQQALGRDGDEARGHSANDSANDSARHRQSTRSPDSFKSDGCKCIAIAQPTGELWIGGFGFVQIWGTAPVKRRLGWKIGHEEISALESSVEANVMCAAASDGFLLIFNLRTGRPMRRLHCHSDRMTSIGVLTDPEADPMVICGSACWDGSLVLCDGFATLSKLGCAAFMTSAVDQSAETADLDCDWLGYYREKSQSSFQHKLTQVRFDESITEAERFAGHQRSWELWQQLSHEVGGAYDWELKDDDWGRTLVQGGIPHQLRSEYWWKMIQMLTADTAKFLNKGYAADEQGFYKRILEHKKGKRSPAIKQIELDLARTLPTNALFRNGQPTLDALRRVLVAFSWLNPRIGYCQGLNRIAAFLLLVLDEERAFWGLVGIVERHMGYEYYTDPLIVARADLSIFKDLITYELPEMDAKFNSIDFDIGAVSFQWFFALFVTSLPAHFALRIWDAFLLQGRDVLFFYALGILKMHEEELMQITDQVEVFDMVTKGLHRLDNVDQLTEVAFTAFSPDLQDRIRIYRQIYEPEAREQHEKALREIAEALQ